eukprot:CAMPEP_0202694366 /NCGR_PEP_ID=MMETSP1385-20130828/8239_1 /ASSEMBLY_ACC=CAM_ASM_000861 /TAXON_ID=933848 /ORGANISM="Elphidium margaritaceum" /LENGTH=407 /DNA_ID=CAMNT_0049350197 /DNA_START=15 /DNA_END=1234 /DNA_ORIENTATION=+
MMFLSSWLPLFLALLYLSHGLQIIDPSRSQLNHAAEDTHDDEDEHDVSSNVHLLHSLDQIAADDDSQELNEQITILSQHQPQRHRERQEHLEKIVKFLQTPIPLSETDHIHMLLNTIVNKTIHHQQGTAALPDLEVLRDFLHQIDNAVDFGKMGGLSIMLQLVLDYPFIEVRTSAAWTIGLSCQNNPTLMAMAHNISTVQNILYLLQSSSSSSSSGGVPSARINLLDANSIHYLSKLIWALSALTRQNAHSYSIFKHYDGSDVVYDWIMEIYNFWNLHKQAPTLLSESYKNKVIEKVLMFASDVVVLSPEQSLFVDDKWCDIFAAHFNYAQKQYAMREITLAYWDVAVNSLFCVNCIPFGGHTQHIAQQHLSIDIGLQKLIKMESEDEFDEEMKEKAQQLMSVIENT